MKWWIELFPEVERAAYANMEQGVTTFRGVRPALLVVDVVRAFVGRPGLTLEESTKEWVTSCGPTAWEAMPHIQRILHEFRRRNLPICYTTGQPGAATKYGGTNKAEIIAMNSPMDLPGAQDIPDEIRPSCDELVLAKPKASAFFGTALVAWMNQQHVDSVVVAGCTTCGCVRSTVVDAVSWGYPVAVAEEACFDRSRLSHGVSLFELNTKYADVMTIEDILKYLEMVR